MPRVTIVTVSLAAVALTCLGFAVASEIELRRYPELWAGLTPLRVPMAAGEVTRASFKAVWSEPHYFALVFRADLEPAATALVAQAMSSVGRTQGNVIPFDFDWRAFERGREVGRGSGRGRPQGAFVGSGERGLIFGKFPVAAGRSYEVEVRVGTTFQRIALMRPVIAVGVNSPGPSVGLPWVKELNRPIAIALTVLGLLFLAGAIWTTRSRAG